VASAISITMPRTYAALDAALGDDCVTTIASMKLHDVASQTHKL